MMKNKDLLLYNFKDLQITENSSRNSINNSKNFIYSFKKSSPDLIKTKDYKNSEININNYKLKVFQCQQKDLTNKELIEYLTYNKINNNKKIENISCLNKLKNLNKKFKYINNNKKFVSKSINKTKKINNNNKMKDKNLEKFYNNIFNFKSKKKNNEIKQVLKNFSYHNKNFLKNIKKLF